jgi:hypothetical protein
MTRRGLRPVAFLAAMLGFGLRLDTAWQGTAVVFLAVAAVLAVAALRPSDPGAFVPGDERR